MVTVVSEIEDGIGFLLLFSINVRVISVGLLTFDKAKIKWTLKTEHTI